MAVGVYEVPKVRFKTASVMTTNTTVGAYRGAGRPEATQLIERVLDVAADKIGMDPAEIRRVNFIQPATFPLTTLTGGNYDSGEYEKSLDAVLVASGYATLRAEQAKRRADGDPKMLGIGLSTYSRSPRPWGCTSSSGQSNSRRRVGGVLSRARAQGRGHHTAFRMLASDVLGIPWTRSSSWTRTPRAFPAVGTLGSRSLQTAGSAIHWHR